MGRAANTEENDPCRSSNGVLKQRWPNAISAWYVAELALLGKHERMQIGKELYAYLCPSCGGWHLASCRNRKDRKRHREGIKELRCRLTKIPQRAGKNKGHEMKLLDVLDPATLVSEKRKPGAGNSGAGCSREAARERVSMQVMDGVSVGKSRELDEYIDLCERVADDPDTEPPARYYELLRKYAQGGASVGFRHGGPVFMSVGKPFLAAASGMQIGVNNAG